MNNTNENAHRMHCFIVEKRDSRIKARAVADRRTQTKYFEEQTYSPTIHLENITLTGLVDEYEG